MDVADVYITHAFRKCINPHFFLPIPQSDILIKNTAVSFYDGRRKAIDHLDTL